MKTPQTRFRQYKDLNLSLPVHPITNDLTYLTNEDAIQRAVRNLILTNFYEKPFQPSFGSGVRQLLFEPFSAVVANTLKNIITSLVQRYEKRVELLSVGVDIDPEDNGYTVTIMFYIVNQIEPVTIDIFLERIR
jgi:phage baseplate assembly protein W